MNDVMTDLVVPDWPCAFGGATATGVIKAQPEDFIVEELLAFVPEGQGEHVFLHIEKIGENTEYVARALARHAGVRQRDVSFAGLKDRHGRTRQWFSVWLPGKTDPDWSALESDNLKILQTVRHARKLKRGVLSGNRFTLVVRDWSGDKPHVERQLQAISTQGFPNYYGEQRFGHNGQNVNRALAMFQGGKVKREQRSIYLSAARSFLFNHILAARINNQTWNLILPGEVCKLENTNSLFKVDTIDPPLLDRLASGDIHPTGVLWGKGENDSRDQVQALEQQVIANWQGLADGLMREDVDRDRRALRVIPQNLHWQFEADNRLHLSFTLPAGSYATALLREIVGS